MTFKSQNSVKTFPAISLVELVLYVSLASLMLLGVSFSFLQTLSSRVKNQSMIEVEQQGQIITQTISRTARNATNLNSPTIGLSSGTISFSVVDVSKSPTIFFASSGVVFMQEGSGAPIALHNNKVAVSGLVFSNYSRTGEPAVIFLGFLLSRVNMNGRQEYSYAKAFKDSISLRK